MRGLPALAILAGGVLSQATNSSSNFIEERMLGADDDEALLLGGPSGGLGGLPVVVMGAGRIMMCGTCGVERRSGFVTGVEGKGLWMRRLYPGYSSLDCEGLGRLGMQVMYLYPRDSRGGDEVLL